MIAKAESPDQCRCRERVESSDGVFEVRSVRRELIR